MIEGHKPDIVIRDALPNCEAHRKVARATLEALGIESLEMPYSTMPLYVMPYLGPTQVRGGLFPKRSFNIWFLLLNCRDYPKFLKQADTLVHELIHASQFAYGDLELDSNKDFLVWKKVRYDLTKLAYTDRPWEKEALATQQSIFKKVKFKLGF